MDLAALEEQIQLLRQRRMHLAEIRDYKPQRSAKAKAKEVTPIDDRPLEETLAGLFKEDPEDAQDGSSGTQTEVAGVASDVPVDSNSGET